MTCPSAADAALELNFGAFYFRCRRVLSKAQLAGIQNPDPPANWTAHYNPHPNLIVILTVTLAAALPLTLLLSLTLSLLTLILTLEYLL